MSIITLLLALALPAMSQARRSAQSVQCLSTVRSVGQSIALIAENRRGFWPMLGRPGDQWVGYWDGESSSVSLDFWNTYCNISGILTPDAWLPGTSPRTWSCPTVWTSGARAMLPPISPEVFRNRADWMRGPNLSYFYSLSLISDPLSWRPNSTVPLARYVHTADIRFPSSKAISIEPFSSHATWRFLAEPGADRFNACFADGSAAPIQPDVSKAYFPADLVQSQDWFSSPAPGIMTAEGAFGRDR